MSKTLKPDEVLLAFVAVAADVFAAIVAGAYLFGHQIPIVPGAYNSEFSKMVAMILLFGFTLNIIFVLLYVSLPAAENN